MKNKKLSVLLVSIVGYPHVKGGVNTMVNTLATETNKEHCAIIFIPGEWKDAEAKEGLLDGNRYYLQRLRFPFDKKRPIAGFLAWLLEMPKIIRNLKKLLVNNQIDVVHLQTLTPLHVYFLLTKLLFGIPYIITLRGSDVYSLESKTWINQQLMKIVLRGASKVYANSNQLADLGTRKIRFLKNIDVIHNGIETRNLFFQKMTNDERSIFEMLPNRFYVSVGSFDYVKGHDILIKAWGRIRASMPNIKLVLIGDGDFRKKYESLAKDMDCEDSIFFLGELTNELTISIVSRAEALILPSRFEGFGNVLIEAGSVKVPVIATSVGGVIDIVEHNINGLLVESEEVESLSAAIILFSSDECLRSRLANNLYEKVLNNFTSAQMVKKYLAAYRSVLI